MSNIFKFDKRQAHFSESSKSNKLFKFIIKLNETFPFNLFLGEGGLVYIFISFYKARKFLKSGNIQSDILITPFRPMSNVIIGFLLKTFYSKMRWVVSVHDLPINHFRPNVYFKKLQHNIWNRIFTQADYVITLSHGLANDLKTFGANASVVENGINVRSPKSDQNQKFTILYSGSLYQDMIEPFDFFNAIENILKNGKFHLINWQLFMQAKMAINGSMIVLIPSTYSIINCVGNITC
ncbi:MAG: glycosyltransferase [Saprospiraceae bacterium]